jgi:hypothetical protein
MLLLLILKLVAGVGDMAAAPAASVSLALLPLLQLEISD